MSRHPYLGLGADRRYLDNPQGRAYHTFQALSIARTQRVRPALSDGGETVIADQAGKVDSNMPDDAAASFPWGSLEAQAWSSHQKRLFYRLECPVLSFKLFLADSPQIVNVNEPRAHEVFVDAITDTALDLNNVTWNNQDALEYESVFSGAFFRIYQSLSVPGTGLNLSNSTNVSPATRYNDEGFSLASGKLIYGFRVRWDGDTAYSGAEEAHFKHTMGIRLFL